MVLPQTLPLSQELLQYYRSRLEKAEQDYIDALKAIEDIKLKHQEFHEITWYFSPKA